MVGHLNYEDTMSYQLTVRASDIFTGNFAEALVNITVEVNSQNIHQFKFLIIIAMNPYIFKYINLFYDVNNIFKQESYIGLKYRYVFINYSGNRLRSPRLRSIIGLCQQLMSVGVFSAHCFSNFNPDVKLLIPNPVNNQHLA